MTKKKSVGKFIADWAMVILLVILIVFFSIASPGVFLTGRNITNILVQNVHVAIVTIAVFIIMVSGGCDLSIGYQVSIAAVLCTKMLTSGLTFGSYTLVFSVPIAIITAIVICALLGCLNGFLTQALKSTAMIITLGTMAIFHGLSYLISDSKTYHNLPTSFMQLGQGKIGVVPINVIILIVIAAIAIFVMAKTSIGRSVYAAGDNPEAARLAGLNVNRIKILSFTVAGALVGVAAVLLASRSGSADSGTGVGIEFTGITACVLSGVALKGGEGTLWKAIVAVFVLGILSNGMQLIGLGAYPQYIAQGIIMLFSIYLSSRNNH